MDINEEEIINDIILGGRRAKRISRQKKKKSKPKSPKKKNSKKPIKTKRKKSSKKPVKPVKKKTRSNSELKELNSFEFKRFKRDLKKFVRKISPEQKDELFRIINGGDDTVSHLIDDDIIINVSPTEKDMIEVKTGMGEIVIHKDDFTNAISGADEDESEDEEIEVEPDGDYEEEIISNKRRREIAAKRFQAKEEETRAFRINVEWFRVITSMIASNILYLESFIPLLAPLSILADQIDASQNIWISMAVIGFHIMAIMVVVYVVTTLLDAIDCGYARMIYGSSTSSGYKYKTHHEYTNYINSRIGASDIKTINSYADKSRNKNEGTVILSIIYYLTMPIGWLFPKIAFYLRYIMIAAIQSCLFIIGAILWIFGKRETITSLIYCGTGNVW